MTRIIATAGAVLAFAVSASAASAASLPVYGQQSGSSVEAGLIEVHGVHRACKLGYRGWHRSTPWGERIRCRPHYGHHGYGYGRGRDHDDDRGRGGRGGSHDGDRGGRGGDHDGRGHRSNFEGAPAVTKSYDL